MHGDDLDAVYRLQARYGSRAAGPWTPAQRVVGEIGLYLLEIGSGEDFIQWFRWSEPSQVKEMPGLLEEVGASASARLCRRALQLAFGEALDEAYDECLQAIEEAPYFDDRRSRLRVLALKQVSEGNQVADCLARWYAQQRDESEGDAATE